MWMKNIGADALTSVAAKSWPAWSLTTLFRLRDDGVKL
jgi:hypothetical protein